MTGLTRASGTPEESWIISRKLHHGSLSVISLGRPDESLPARGFSPTGRGSLHAEKTKHTCAPITSSKAGLMGSLKSHPGVCGTHTHTQRRKPALAHKLNHSVTFLNKSAYQCSVFVWQISLDMQHFTTLSEARDPLSFPDSSVCELFLSFLPICLYPLNRLKHTHTHTRTLSLLHMQTHSVPCFPK